MLKSITAGLAAALVVLAAPANAQQAIKIGFITTLSGPPAIIGKHMKDSVELALDHLNHRMGGLEVEVVYGDDQFKPEVGVQLAEGDLPLAVVHQRALRMAPDVLGEVIEDARLRVHVDSGNTTRSRPPLASTRAEIKCMSAFSA